MATASHGDGFIPTGLLREIGEALYGPNWTAPLAQECNISYDTMRHAASGKRTLPARMISELIAICTKRGSEVAHIKSRLEAMGR